MATETAAAFNLWWAVIWKAGSVGFRQPEPDEPLEEYERALEAFINDAGRQS